MSEKVSEEEIKNLPLRRILLLYFGRPVFYFIDIYGNKRYMKICKKCKQIFTDYPHGYKKGINGFIRLAIRGKRIVRIRRRLDCPNECRQIER